MVQAGRARFTVLTPSLVRLEYDPTERFEGRPTLFAVRRRLPVPAMTVQRDGEVLTIQTDRLCVRYAPGPEGLGQDNLSIVVPTPAGEVRWVPGMRNTGSLGGTLRTLDECSGPAPLGDGVLSRAGWFVLDDSHAPVLTNGWIAARAADPAAVDWYFFGYGRDYETALRDLLAVAGPVPLPPRFAFGSWYSRYWPYPARDFVKIADQYRAHAFPLDVMVLDMDWHLEGWTGYTWNAKLIPDPTALLKALHARGLRVTLNLHPADGVHPHERAYPAFAEALGRNPSERQPIPFDVTDRNYMREYFRLLHHPLERQGVDFWWIDWQQERRCAVPGLDPLLWLNHLHATDAGRPGTNRRGLLLSRWAGWGNHRYPLHFSGDTHASWEVLRFQVRFTAAGGNVGATYWSHDLGGHYADERTDPELFVRWLQFGAFTAALRVHSTRSAHNDRRPWLDGPPFDEVARRAYALRYRLLPYIYTMARRTYDTGLPLVRPVYLAYPDEERAYRAEGQFLFGDDLLVAPVTQPGTGPQRVADVTVWLPPGTWCHLLTGAVHVGPVELTLSLPLDMMAVFVRAGVPVPMAPPGCLYSRQTERALHVRVHAGPAGSARCYHDDGETNAYQGGRYAWTHLEYAPLDGGAHEIHVGPLAGEPAVVPFRRDTVLELVGTAPPREVRVNERVLSPPQWVYRAGSATTLVTLRALPTRETCIIRVAAPVDASVPAG